MVNVYFDTLCDETKKDTSRQILRRRTAEYLGYEVLWQIKEGVHGKPYFDAGSIKFSISHSGKIIVCAVGDEEVGIDIQEMRDADFDKISERFFAGPEAEYVKLHGKIGFYDIWVRKEAYVKYTGEGFAAGNWQKFTVVDSEGNLRNELTAGENHVRFTEIIKAGYDNYKCVLCTADK